MNEFTEKVFKSKASRFPTETWIKLNELRKKYEAGEITAEELDRKVFNYADYYDNIKTEERWWGKDNCFKIPIGEEANYGIKVKILTPKGEK